MRSTMWRGGSAFLCVRRSAVSCTRGREGGEGVPKRFPIGLSCTIFSPLHFWRNRNFSNSSTEKQFYRNTMLNFRSVRFRRGGRTGSVRRREFTAPWTPPPLCGDDDPNRRKTGWKKTGKNRKNRSKNRLRTRKFPLAIAIQHHDNTRYSPLETYNFFFLYHLITTRRQPRAPPNPPQSSSAVFFLTSSRFSPFANNTREHDTAHKHAHIRVYILNS